MFKGGPPEQESPRGLGARAALGLAVLGIVYGDIGTSPIYALRQAFIGTTGVAVTAGTVLGVLSLVFWTLVIIISLKYMTFVLQADNQGEGGIFALIALLRPWRHLERRRRLLLILFGLLGASLLYGGVIITPAISILSAVEGLQVATPGLERYVVPTTIAILVALFAFQSRGTARVGIVFGPVMLLWFLAMAVLGAESIVDTPRVLAALNPYWAFHFFQWNAWIAFLVMYAVFLVSTGGEALYADLGHFGRKPIRWVWFGFVLPALLLNYFGQGALLLREPGIKQPFYHLAPQWLLYPLVGLATLATIIASQAAITGAFSLTRQAIQLGMMPRLRVTQTSHEVRGQIYIAAVNWALMAATIAVVLMFQSSSALAAAYGAAVNGTMIVTTVLAFVVAREIGRWKRPTALLFLVFFLSVDLLFFATNAMKIPDGGWFPIVIGLVFFLMMSTWRRGGQCLTEERPHSTQPLEELIQQVDKEDIARVPGAAVFLSAHVEDSPRTLPYHVWRNRALQKQVIVLTVLIEDVARIAPDERIEFEELEHGFMRVILHYGYMQGVNVPSDLAICKKQGMDLDLDEVTYYTGNLTVVPSSQQRCMWKWRGHLLSFLMRNAASPSDYYQLPVAQTVILGVPVRL
nr:KUP/HAK/KT family potassium transporter [Oleiagrimonas sp. C23AA]